jgi:hypothetical protein
MLVAFDTKLSMGRLILNFVSTAGIVLSAFFVWVGVELVVTDNGDLGGRGLGVILLAVFVPLGFLCLRSLRSRLKREPL